VAPRLFYPACITRIFLYKDGKQIQHKSNMFKMEMAIEIKIEIKIKKEKS